MKRIITIIISCLITAICMAKPDSTRELIISTCKFNDSYLIDGIHVGRAASCGKFYALSEKLSQSGTKDEFIKMLSDTNPAVRIMGLVCLGRINDNFDILLNDKTTIFVQPYGCVIRPITVESFSQKLKSDSEYQYCYGLTKRNPNQKLEREPH